APIISIGAIFFDPQTGDMGPEFIKTIDLETAGGVWICPYISRHLLSLNPSLAHCRRYSRGER
ncbi:TPA: hypothetical protein HMV73_02230, partial [Escherichia coli]|nr:hypothetical protein [Escherichia coli]